MLGGVLAMGVLFLLLRVVRTLRYGNPFVLVLIAWGKLAVLEHPVIAPYVIKEFDVSFVPLLAGLGIAVLAEVFRQGARLRRDMAGLV